MEEIPEELKHFITASFEAVDHLRILLLLRSSPETQWSPMSVSARLYLQPHVAQKGLAILQQKGFLTVDTNPDISYSYQPQNETFASLIDAVVELDKTRPVTLIKLIYERPKDPLQSFADAFKLRRDS